MNKAFMFLLLLTHIACVADKPTSPCNEVINKYWLTIDTTTISIALFKKSYNSFFVSFGGEVNYFTKFDGCTVSQFYDRKLEKQFNTLFIKCKSNNRIEISNNISSVKLNCVEIEKSEVDSLLEWSTDFELKRYKKWFESKGYDKLIE